VRNYATKPVTDDCSSAGLSPLVDDDLRDALRTLSCVPNAHYLVRDGLVFVFSALLRHVKRELTRRHLDVGTKALPLIVDELMPSVWMPALNAVRDFGILPRFCSPVVVQTGTGDVFLGLLHDEFNALYPRLFKTTSERFTALADLLLGQPLAGEIHNSGERSIVGVSGGSRREIAANLLVSDTLAVFSRDVSKHFVCEGQAFVALEPYGAEGLPIAPVVADGAPLALDVFVHLEACSYQGELTNLSTQAFQDLRAAERHWLLARAFSVGTVSSTKMATVASIVAKAFGQLKWISSKRDTLAQKDLPLISELSTLYPELRSVPPSILAYDWRGFEFARIGWCCEGVPIRDCLFPLYILGRRVAGEDDGFSPVIDCGAVLVHGMLNGLSLAQSFERARAWWVQEQVVGGRVWRAWRIAKCLESLRSRSAGVGEPITTWADSVKSDSAANEALSLPPMAAGRGTSFLFAVDDL